MSLFELATKKKVKEPVKTVTVRMSDNGGYIVSYYDNGKDIQHTYASLKGVTKCIAETLEPDSEKQSENENTESDSEDGE